MKCPGRTYQKIPETPLPAPIVKEQSYFPWITRLKHSPDTELIFDKVTKMVSSNLKLQLKTTN